MQQRLTALGSAAKRTSLCQQIFSAVSRTSLSHPGLVERDYLLADDLVGIVDDYLIPSALRRLEDNGIVAHVVYIPLGDLVVKAARRVPADPAELDNGLQHAAVPRSTGGCLGLGS